MSLGLFLLSGPALAGTDEPTSPPSAPPQAAREPKLAKSDSKSKARKWRSKRKERSAKKVSAKPAAIPATSASGTGPATAPAPLTAAALAPDPTVGRINPVLAAAAVSLPAAFVGPVSQSVTTPSLEAADLAMTAERIRKSWLLASSMGPPAMGVAVATLSAVTVPEARAALGASASADPSSPGNPSVWDTHLPSAAAAVPGATSPYGKVRVFGHVAINHWEGERRVGIRAGPKGTTDISDAVIGVETRPAEDMELRIRALTILPALAQDGDGALNGAGTVTIKDYLYMRDVYVGFLRLFKQDALNVRFGRVAIPFGDEYKEYDSPLNPLVSHSVPFFWGFDEGLQVYGDITPEISYSVQAFLGPEAGNGADETPSRARGVRLEGNHGEHWHWSASYHNTGETGKATQLTSFYFGREEAQPIGLTGSAGGASPSALIRSEWWEGDVRYKVKHGHLALARGGGSIRDDAAHSRDFEWFKIEPLWSVARKWDVVGRYSGMNVRNALLGYRFNSFETIGTELNFDVNERQRLSVGTRYRVNEVAQIKLEHTFEEWKLIPGALAASKAADPLHRDYSVLQAVVSF